MDLLNIPQQAQPNAITTTATPSTSSSSSNSNMTTAEFFLTSEQHRVLSELLPKGYSLQFAPKPIRQKSCSFTKTPAAAVSSLIRPEMQPRSQPFATPASAVPIRQPSTLSASEDVAGGQFSLDQMNSNSQQQQQLYYDNSEQISDANNNSNITNGTNNNSNNRRKQPASRKNSTTPAARNQKRKADAQVMLPGLTKQRMSGMNANMSGMSSEESKKCFNILHSLQKNKCANPFLYPVDPIRQGCPDYLSVVRDPMDLSTVERNLKSNVYQSRTQFAADIRKIWNNSYIYNSRESQIYNMTLEMDKFFEKKFEETEHSNNNSDVKNIQNYMKILAQAINNQQSSHHMNMNTQTVAFSKQQSQQNHHQSHRGGNNNNSNNSHASSKKAAKKVPSKMDTPMTMQEKKNLGASIMQLPHDNLRGIWEIVKTDDNQEYDGSILRFDLDTLSVRKTRELENYVKQKTAAAAKKQTKKQVKVDDKAANKINQHGFTMGDDETAATNNHDLVHTQDMTQSTMTPGNTQPMHTSQQHYAMPSHNMQQPIQHQQQHYANEVKQQYHSHHQGHHGMTPTYSPPQQMHQQNMIDMHANNDIDSESSFISGDSDSQEYA